MNTINTTPDRNQVFNNSPRSVDDRLDCVEARVLQLLAVGAGDAVLLQHLHQQRPELLLVLHLLLLEVGLLSHRCRHGDVTYSV